MLVNNAHLFLVSSLPLTHETETTKTEGGREREQKRDTDRASVIHDPNTGPEILVFSPRAWKWESTGGGESIQRSRLETNRKH